MARSLNDIQQDILERKDATPELSALEVLTPSEQASLEELNSSSKVAVWRLIVYIVAYAIFTFELLMDVFRNEITTLVKANRPHTVDWYKTKALAFQLGDTLVESDEYYVIDTSKQIIKQVAVLEGDRKIIIKVATSSETELIAVPNNTGQLDSFVAYIDKVKDAGTELEIISENADKLRVAMDFYYDALVVDSNGLEINTGANVVETAIKNYLKSLSFNGEFEINKMVDYLQMAVGYKSLRLSLVGGKSSDAPSYTEITRNYLPLSGYMKLEDLDVTYYASI